MRRFLKWFAARFNVRKLAELAAEALREFGLLWAVFSVLDRLMSREPLTMTWLIANLVFAFVLWLTGALLEARISRRIP